MNDTFHCADHEALVAYLYDECEPADRAAITAHVAHCAACAEELASLRATRTQLASWTPPAASLGFQITRADGHNEPLAFATRDGVVGPASPGASGPRSSLSSGTPERRSSLSSGTPERRSSWWREPLPAWAQVAAAVLIFAAGLTAGALGGASRSETAAVAPAASPMPAQAPEQVESRQSLAVPSAPAVSVADLARLEQRLRAIESAQTVNASVRTVSAASVADGGAQLTPAGVLALIDQRLGVSEDRLRNDIALVAGAASDIEAQVVALQQRLPRTGVVTYEQFVERNRERELLTTPVSFPGRPGR